MGVLNPNDYGTVLGFEIIKQMNRYITLNYITFTLKYITFTLMPLDENSCATRKQFENSNGKYEELKNVQDENAESKDEDK